MSVSAANMYIISIKSPDLHFSLATGCSSGDVRLADQVSNIEGRVEVCYNGEWGTICARQWGRLDARVVCRQLGLPTACKTMYAIAIVRRVQDTSQLGLHRDTRNF